MGGGGVAVVQIKARFNKVQYHGGTMKRAFGIEREREGKGEEETESEKQRRLIKYAPCCTLGECHDKNNEKLI